MPNDPKKSLLLIGLTPKKKEAESDSMGDMLKTAARDLIAAVKEDDVQGVMDALRASHMACASDSGESEDME